MKIREIEQADGRICRIAVPENPVEWAGCAGFTQPELDSPGETGLTAACGEAFERPQAARNDGETEGC